MKNKIVKKISVLSSITAMVALLVAFGMGNVAFADRRGGHGGDNRGRGNNNASIQSMSDSSRGRSSEGMSLTSIINHDLEEDGDDEDNRGPGNNNLDQIVNNNLDNRGPGNNNLNNLDQINDNNFRAIIRALENLIRQLEARILFLEQRNGVADVTPPVISDIRIRDVTATKAEIRWRTNEPATSKIYLSLTTPVNLATAAVISNSNLVMNHSIDLMGLAAGTAYHFVVESADRSNNVSRSAEMSFTTAAVSDITPPVISAITSAGISATTANITWTTNEPATSKVFFSATTPVNLATAASVSDPSLVMNHSLHLGGLTANTTFHFVVESKDASNNTSTSAEQSFATAP